MASKRKRRIRSPHPGVVLLKRKLPSGAVRWQARYTDPATGKVKTPILNGGELQLTTAEARELWAKRKSKELARRRLELESGAHAVQSTDLAKAVESYYEAAKHRLRPTTLTTYRLGTDSLVEFMVRSGARKTGDVNRARLVAWRDELIAAPHRSARKGGKRGEYADTDGRRRAASINQRLRSAKTVLNHLRTASRLRLASDDIRDALKPLRAPQEAPHYLKPAQLRKLLRAALRHDAACHELTRAEKAGEREPGTTQKHEPIAAFVAAALLTGMRRGELLALTWADVDLDALDAQGEAVGELTVRADVSKTHRERTVGLEVAPQLRTLLAKLRLRVGDRAGRRRVFESLTVDLVEAARARLVAEYGAPPFSWQVLRSTASTYLVNAPAVFGAAAPFLAAKQLGHSVEVAEKHYSGLLRGLSRDATDLPSAMQVQNEVSAVVASGAGCQRSTAARR